MSLEDFEKLANQVAQPEEQKVEEPAKAAEVTPAVEDEPEEVVYRREIDLGDGAGVQVFEGGSYDELIDKLANAQLHATRKIRELSAVKKAEAAKEELTPEQEFLLAQELTSKPSKVLKSVFESMVGMPIEEFKKKQAKLEQLESNQSSEQAAVEFVNATPDYFANPRNGERMTRYLQTYKMERTTENFKKAFADLSGSGLLEAKPASNGAANKQDDPDTRIAEAEPRTVVTQRKAGSGLSSRGRSASSGQKTELTLADLEAMPMEQLEAMQAAYNASVRGA